MPLDRMDRPLLSAVLLWHAIGSAAVGQVQSPAPNETGEQAVPLKPYTTDVAIPPNAVLVEVLEGLPDEWTWNFVPPMPSERYTQRELAFVELPKKYTSHGVIDDRSSPFAL